MTFNEHLVQNHISFTFVNGIYVIDDNTFEPVYPIEGKLFDEDFRFIQKDFVPTDFKSFSFGGNWYYTPSKELEISLNKMMYLGKKNLVIKSRMFLGVHGGFDILNGSGQYAQWVKKAKFLGLEYLGICERNTLAGVVKFQLACQASGIKPIIGATFTIMKEAVVSYDVKVYAKNERGWENLLKINKEVNCVNQRFIEEGRFKSLLDGLIVVFDPKSMAHSLSLSYPSGVYYYQFDDVVYEDPALQAEYFANLALFARSADRPVGITDAYYLEAADYGIKYKLNQIANCFYFKSQNQHFKDVDEYAANLDDMFKHENQFYGILAEILESERIILDNNDSEFFKVKLGQRWLPEYRMTPEEASEYKTNDDLFWGLIERGLKKIDASKLDRYLSQIEIEYEVIRYGCILDYFLMLHDIISWCRRNNILVGIGRGSAGGSTVSMLLGLIFLDPFDYDLLFSRFLNKGRVAKTLPDIDTDVESARREEVREYIGQRFGTDQLVSVGTYTNMQCKAAIKDLGKIYGLMFEDVNAVTRELADARTMVDLFKIACANAKVSKFVKENVDLINDAFLIIGQPKAKSVHACALIVYPDTNDKFQWSPCRLQDGLYVTEWEGAEMETVGFLKEDILGVTQLDKFNSIIQMIPGGVDIYSIPYDDREVYAHFKKGYNEGCFHFGTHGLTKYCREMKPDNLNDLIAAISLFRPGSIANNYHNEYVLRKQGGKDVVYFTGSEEIFKDTYGVIVYQEQVMRICQVLGGLTDVEADDVRRAMVKKKYDELKKYEVRFLAYYVEKYGVTPEYAKDVWTQVDKASSYLFNKSHAAAYAITGYISQWFKIHYPIPYWVTTFKFMSSDDINKNKVSEYISEIQHTGSIVIKTVDVNGSSFEISSLGNAIYWPINNIPGIGEITASQILSERDAHGKYFSLEEFVMRHTFTKSKVNKSHIEKLIMAGAFDLFYDKYDLTVGQIRKTLLKEFWYLKGMTGFPLPVESMFDYWWLLKQHELSGLAQFDYPKLCGQYFVDRTFLHSRDYQENLGGGYYAIGGLISDVKETTNSKGSKYLNIWVCSNYETVKVTIFGDHYKMLSDEKRASIKKGVIILMTIKVQNYQGANTFKYWDDSEIITLGDSV